MKLKLTALLAMALTLAACSTKVDAGDSGGTIVTSGDDSGIQPKPAVTFDYSRMMYDTSGVCGQENFYFKLLSVDDLVIGKRDGEDVRVDSRILLYPNKRFEVEIHEKYILRYTDSGYAYKKMKSRYVSGTYVETNGKLILGDLMEITGLEADKRVVASIFYKKDVMSQGLANQAITGHMVWSTSAIKSDRETCPNFEDTFGDFAKFQARPDRTVLQLKALQSDQQLYMSGFYINKMRLVLEMDGSYAIVAQISAPGSGLVSNNIIDSGYWEQSAGTLRLYYGVLSLGFLSNEATLQFNHDLTIFVNGNAYSLPMNGKSVSMKFGPSDLTIDDLTDTYR